MTTTLCLKRDVRLQLTNCNILSYSWHRYCRQQARLDSCTDHWQQCQQRQLRGEEIRQCHLTHQGKRLTVNGLLTPLPLSDALSAFPSEARPHRCHQTMDVLVHANPCCWLWPTLLSAKSWLSWFTNHNTTGPTTTKSEDVFLQHIFRRLTSVTSEPHQCTVWLLDHFVKCPSSILMWSVTIISAFVRIITNAEIIVTLFIVTQVCQAYQSCSRDHVILVITSSRLANGRWNAF